MRKDIKNLIEKYAEVYKEFEKFQTGENPVLTNGDQKTGVIGEFMLNAISKKI